MRAAMAWPTHANHLHGLENWTAAFFFRSRKEKVAAGFCAIPYWDVSIFRSWESIKIINSISKLRIKQNELREDLCLLRRFSIDGYKFLTHEYDILLSYSVSWRRSVCFQTFGSLFPPVRYGPKRKSSFAAIRWCDDTALLYAIFHKMRTSEAV